MASPNYTEGVIWNPQTLAKGAVLRATLDLRTAGTYGAWVTIMVGRGGTTALSSGVQIIFRRTYNNDAVRNVAPGPTYGGIVAAAGAHTIAATVTSGQSIISKSAAAPPAAGQYVVIWGTATVPGGGTTLTVAEFARVAAANSSNITLDAPVKQTHGTGELIYDQGDAFTAWLDGGATYEIVADYGAPANGETVLVAAYQQTAAQ